MRDIRRAVLKKPRVLTGLLAAESESDQRAGGDGQKQDCGSTVKVFLRRRTQGRAWEESPVRLLCGVARRLSLGSARVVSRTARMVSAFRLRGRVQGGASENVHRTCRADARLRAK